MASTHELVERWFAQTIESYPDLSAGFLASERDPFRNPAGHALRSGMSAIMEELLGNWDTEKIAAALDPIIRLRAVQDFTPSQAVGFVFLLRPILLATSLAPPATIEARIDQLALITFDHYMKCREQIAEVRANEVQRRIRLRPVLRSQ